jgi:hypothetical protein
MLAPMYSPGFSGQISKYLPAVVPMVATGLSPVVVGAVAVAGLACLVAAAVDKKKK